MKKAIYFAGALAFTAMVSCNKTENGNKSVLATETSAQTNNEEKGVTQRYVAEDGSSALVTVKENEDDRSISVRSNSKTITAPWKSEGMYSNYDFEIIHRNDSVTITQGNNVIRLKKAGGQ